jgi:hypothetical protein
VSELHPRALRDRVPRCRIERDLRAPDPEPHGVDHGDQHDLRDHRIAQAQGTVDGPLEFRHILGGDDAPLDELADDGAQALVHDQLGRDQDRQRDEETHVRLDVVEERDRGRAPERIPRERG